MWLEKTFLGSIASRGSDFDSLRRVFNVSCIVGGEKEMVLTVLQGEAVSEVENKPARLS